VFSLTADQVSFLTDTVILHPGNFAIDVFMDPFTYLESMQLVEVYDHGFGWEPVPDFNGQPSFTQISPAYFQSLDDLNSYIFEQDLHPIGFVENLPDPGTDPGIDPGTGEGVPVFSLTADQVSFLTDTVILHPGNFAIDVFMDPFTYLESMQLVEVYDHGFGWEPVLDYNEQPVSTPISSAFFPTVQDLDFYLVEQGLTPIGFIYDITDPNSDPGTGQGFEINAPIVVTHKHLDHMGSDMIILSAEIMSDGNAPIYEKGFLISENIRFDFHERLSSFYDDPASTTFEAQPYNLIPGNTYYYRAYAINEIGESLGSIKRVKVPGFYDFDSPWKANPELAGGWRESPWFGAYLLMENNWMYHGELGWIYVQPDSFGSHWLWIESYGWLWTQETTWPFLYSHDLGTWLYFIKSIDGKPVFYNYENNHYEYTPVDYFQ